VKSKATDCQGSPVIIFEVVFVPILFFTHEKQGLKTTDTALKIHRVIID